MLRTWENSDIGSIERFSFKVKTIKKTKIWFNLYEFRTFFQVYYNLYQIGFIFFTKSTGSKLNLLSYSITTYRIAVNNNANAKLLKQPIYSQSLCVINVMTCIRYALSEDKPISHVFLIYPFLF